MSRNSKDMPTLWMIVNHPMHLADILALTDTLKKRGGIKIGLIYISHDYWGQTRMEKYGRQFFRVIRLEKILEPGHWRDYTAINGLILQAQQNLKVISENDFLLFFDFGYTAHNVILSVCPDQPRALVINEKLDLAGYRQFLYRDPSIHLKSHRLMNLLELRHGLESTIKLIVPTKGGGVSEWALHFRKPLEEIFPNIFLETFATKEEVQELNREFPAFRCVKAALSGIAVKVPTEVSGHRKKVVFFSGGWGLYYKTNRGKIVDALNRSLEYIRLHFPGCQWVYRPHPFYEGEESLLQLDGFEVERDGELAQVYLLDQWKEIECVVSDLSSCTVLAAVSGLPSLCIGKMLPIDEEEKEVFIKKYSLHPAVQFLTDFKQPLNFPDIGAIFEENSSVSSLENAVSTWTGIGADQDHPCEAETPTAPDHRQNGEADVIRDELERMRSIQAENRRLRVSLEEKEQIIQELKKAADERLELINKLSGKK